MVDLCNGNIKTVILAGGKGTRLKPLTCVFPKPLVPLGNKPILEILLRRLSLLGLTNITLCTGYLSELIVALCGDGTKYGLDISYSKEESSLGTAGPLSAIRDLTDPFITMNGDLLTTLNFNRMLNFHVEQQASLTVAVFRRNVKIDFGVVETDESEDFVGFTEKPTYHFDVSMGINVIGRSAMQYVKDGQFMNMPDLIMKVHESGGKVCCYSEECYWLDIGRLDDYALAQEQFSENENMFLGNIS